MGYVMVSVLGSASGVFAVSARQFQSKAQDIWQGLRQNAAAGPSAAAKGIQDFIDPDTRARLDAQKKDTDSLVSKLASGGEDAKEAAARKKDEAKQKLKMLKLQAQLAAASGDKKAAARIAKEAASVAKELGQAAKDYAGGGDAVSGAAAPSQSGAQAAAPEAAPGDAAGASAEAQNVAQQANQTANQPDAAQTATPDQQARAAVPGTAVPPDGKDPKEAGQPSGSTANPDANDDLQAKRDAIIRDGAVRVGNAQFEGEMRSLMDQLRAIHQQMKNLARKDGSAGTKAEMERAEQDMAEGDRTLNEAFGPSGSTTLSASAVSGAQVDITA